MNNLIGKKATYNKISYLVQGWYLDSNGCLKTYGLGYIETFADLTSYE